MAPLTSMWHWLASYGSPTGTHCGMYSDTGGPPKALLSKQYATAAIKARMKDW